MTSDHIIGTYCMLGLPRCLLRRVSLVTIQGPIRQQAQQYEEAPYQYHQQQHHRQDQPQRQEYSSSRVNTHPHLKRPALAASTYDGSPSAPKYAAIGPSPSAQSTIVRSNLRQIQCVDDPMTQQRAEQR